MRKFLKNIGIGFDYHLFNEDPKTAFERIMKIVTFILMLLFCMLVFIFLICYFILGLFILDGLYWIIAGNTIIWKHLET